MRRGGFHCTAVLEDQAFNRRPVAAVSSLRTPIDGLYLGGSAVHPHGGIIGGPGYNCLQALAEDFDLHGKLKLKKKIWDDAVEQWRQRYRARGIEL